MSMPASLSRRRALVALGAIATGGVATFTGSRTVWAAQQDQPVSPTSADTLIGGPVVVATGSGSAEATADRALIQIIARSTMAYPSKGGMEGDVASPVAEGAAPSVSEEQLQAAASVFLDAGIAQDKVLIVGGDANPASGFFGPGVGMIGVEVDSAQLADLPALIDSAKAALEAEGLRVDVPTAMYLADTCEDLRGEALRNAVAAAREDAETLAAALEVEIVGLRKATEFGYSFGPYAYTISPGDSCDALPALEDLPRTYLPVYDRTMDPVFMVFATVELTFDVQ